MFKPMLAGTIKDTSTLKFPVLASIKLDGIRCTVQGGQLLSRNLKPIPNFEIQKMFKGLPDGWDGELIYGDPSAEDCFRNTSSIVMSYDKRATHILFYVFDHQGLPLPFEERIREVWHERMKYPHVHVVEHERIENEEQLLRFEADALANGHEGVMVRSLNGPYKQGRSTVNEGYLLKLKRFEDSEAEILGVEEQQHNENEAKTNALGHTERSTAKAGLVGAGIMGKFNVRDIKTGVEFDVGTGPTADERKTFWKDRSKLIGKIIKYKFFPTGGKEKPRFPVYLGFRDERDMS